MIVDENTRFHRTYALSVGAAEASGHVVYVSCPEHRVPRLVDTSPAGPLAKRREVTWVELFPHLVCSVGECGRPAARLTVSGRDRNGDPVQLLRICDEQHSFPAPGQKHVVGSSAFERQKRLLADGAVRSHPMGMRI